MTLVVAVLCRQVYESQFLTLKHRFPYLPMASARTDLHIREPRLRTAAAEVERGGT
jgi:hypothetical protein